MDVQHLQPLAGKLVAVNTYNQSPAAEKKTITSKPTTFPGCKEFDFGSYILVLFVIKR